MTQTRPSIWLLGATLAGLDELKRFPSEASRRRALEAWSRAGGDLGRPLWLLRAVVAADVAVVLIHLIVWLLEIITPALPGLAVIRRHPVITGAVVFFLLLWWLHRRAAARALRIELLRAGVPICAKCGYLLEGLPEGTGRCPECGHGVEEVVAAAAARRAAESEASSR